MTRQARLASPRLFQLAQCGFDALLAESVAWSGAMAQKTVRSIARELHAGKGLLNIFASAFGTPPDSERRSGYVNPESESNIRLTLATAVTTMGAADICALLVACNVDFATFAKAIDYSASDPRVPKTKNRLLTIPKARAAARVAFATKKKCNHHYTSSRLYWFLRLNDELWIQSNCPSIPFPLVPSVEEDRSALEKAVEMWIAKGALADAVRLIGKAPGQRARIRDKRWFTGFIDSIRKRFQRPRKPGRFSGQWDLPIKRAISMLVATKQQPKRITRRVLSTVTGLPFQKVGYALKNESLKSLVDNANAGLWKRQVEWYVCDRIARNATVVAPEVHRLVARQYMSSQITAYLKVLLTSASGNTVHSARESGAESTAA